ncbi:CDP-alcohol phosphatidyltransferase family protein [Ethanoligenens harbinense]|uniref:CDP-alcohol phosphatidyltransferase n=1 Tax=Ethanoligenens harbinense (strain DSM 18485 / JCM 12961 / CGMCC 1.5033 / YUAN-3) TaxID=663278 RepID=E6U5R8_ETHHY|nr:CDP-alcohol phosphatidyltransferase family protein [Ethanoligenens harbinense]ADU26827.1 CDP-alcohol phosphatidyltransferase [Ethanoligenens harbinense YUAN-3]AVQ95933.1 CDP-alcohol phosphatidyltransferase [Ethanoligenens harbinense YUAN-3]AYF38595.1 CDP-alcohol phosphatidyltransferase [Ethanoligenens harbinense]AYF41341.1 CDP-alcohol phosphatidyltransferase [Ethanoligenens harbinense]QCN92174.1 CDP-alcohol phosphatidyltransferase family protein [Ethanoligenens harbinense]
MNRKAIPNLLTATHMVLTVALLLPTVPSAAFAVLYLAAGLTDMLDGWLARRLLAESVFGARLDSAADFFFVVVALFRLWPVAAPGTAVLLWVGAIAVLRLGAALAAKVRFGRFNFLHTCANKYTGLLLFCYPFSLFFTRSQIVLYILCAAATLSAAEELLVELTVKHWDPNRAGLLIKAK